ncbi:CDK9 kinase-activating protein cyclin T [Ceraceosorus bombacis]|uniref:CDK9 kinase-activating protein cyclin T n=1 Tax=Ceraceosorus bombacis TaxID=401625 RepID=A0A0P1BHT4_9BASI|nr:CDK9 kinase-activating protein cyclin T [Ceraceosorus bombacis]
MSTLLSSPTAQASATNNGSHLASPAYANVSPSLGPSDPGASRVERASSAIETEHSAQVEQQGQRQADPPEGRKLEAPQWLFRPADMEHTPSAKAGMSQETERYLRAKGVGLIFRTGEGLRVGMNVMATAAIFFHRFFMRKTILAPGDHRRNHVNSGSMDTRAPESFSVHEVAPAALWLACKVEESHRRTDKLVTVTMAVNDKTKEGMRAAERGNYTVDVEGREYAAWRESICYCEAAVLEALCFDLIIDAPHQHLIQGCKALGVDRDLTLLSVALMNNCLYNAVCTFWDAPILAACVFYEACAAVGLQPEEFQLQRGFRAPGIDEPSQGWLDAFDVDESELQEALPSVSSYLAFYAQQQRELQAQAQAHAALASGGSQPHSEPPDSAAQQAVERVSGQGTPIPPVTPLATRTPAESASNTPGHPSGSMLSALRQSTLPRETTTTPSNVQARFEMTGKEGLDGSNTSLHEGMEERKSALNTRPPSRHGLGRHLAPFGAPKEVASTGQSSAPTQHTSPATGPARPDEAPPPPMLKEPRPASESPEEGEAD